MGDRVLVQVVNDFENPTEISPVAYGHWAGEDMPEILNRLEVRMVGRRNDVAYTFARLVQEMINGDTGNLSFGCWNSTEVLTKDKSHGDGGVVLVNVATNPVTYKAFGGYYVTDGRNLFNRNRDPELEEDEE